MKRFQSIIQKYITNHERHKKYLAGVLALSVLVSFGVSAGLIMPAISMTEDDMLNDTYLYDDSIQTLANDNAGKTVTSVKGDNQTTDVVLLAGSNTENPIYGNSVQEVISKADATYALGIASQFCVFLNEDFTEWQADAEGRVAVGGDVYFKDQYGSYSIAKGDFNNKVSLQKLLNNSGFASLVLGGAVKQGRMDDTYYNDSHQDCNDGSDSGKLVDINQESVDSDYSYYVDNSSDPLKTGFPENSSGEWKKVDQRQVYVAKLFDFDAEFNKLKNNSKQLSSVAKSKGISITEDDINGDTVTFDAGMLDKTQDVVYFNVTADVWDKIRACEFYKFEGIPNLTTPRDVVLSKDATTTKWKYADIIINIEPNYYDFTANELDTETRHGMILANGDVKTSINGQSISKGLGDKANNDIGVTSLLWNIHSETEFDLKLGKNFQGTILAPNARVTDGGFNKTGNDTNTAGHLSGALIAKSFNGGTEFGYRPYLGSVSLFKSSSGYGVPIRKIIAGTETPLPNATFGVFKDGSDTPESTFTSDADGNGYVNIPSQVDFSGDTIYTTDNNNCTASYTIKETDAPTGFVKDDSKTYNITVTETVGTADGDIIPIDGKSIPTKVTTVIIQGDESFTIELHDIYSYENGTYKRIRRELKIYDKDNNLKDTFFMDIDGDGKVTRVMRDDNNPTDEKLNQYAPTDQFTWEVQNDTKELNATEYIYKSDLGGVQSIENIIVYKDEDGNYNYITNTTNESGETVTSEPVSITPDTSVYKVTGGENYRFVKSDESGEKDAETSGDVFVNSDGYYLENVDENTLIEVHEKVVEEVDDALTEEQKNSTAYNIGQIAWNNETFPTVNKLIFYYKDGNSQSKTNVNITGSGNWRNFDLSSLNTSNVIGIKIITSGDEKAKLCVQDTSNNNINALCAFGDNDSGVNGTIRLKETPSTHEEISYQAVSTKVDVRYALKKPVLSTIEHACYNPIYSGDEAQAPQTYTSNDVTYKYDPEIVMMMPQPSETKTFTNKRGLVFKKVGKSGDAEEALKGAKIAVKSVAVSGDSLVIGDAVTGMDNILDGGSETTVDVNKLVENQLYCFEETEAPGGYETANPIYFKKSGNTIYYTTDVDKAKSDNTEGWESVDLTKNGTDTQDCITMTDIKISGAKIRLSKWKNGTMTNNADRLGGAKFQLCASDGTTAIYPLGTPDTFTIEKDTDFDLYETLKNATDGTYNPEYIKNGYLKPGIYVLKEVNAPTGYDAQEKFGFSVKAGANGTYEIRPVASDKADEGDMYLSTGDGNPVLIITGKLLEMAKENPDENFVENLWKVNQVHVSSDGSSWGGNLSILNKDSYTFNEILSASGKNADEIKFIRFMQWEDKNKSYNDATSPYYDGAPASSGGSGSGSGSGSDDGTGLINGMNGNNGTVTVSGALLEEAKKYPDKEFIQLDKTGGGQIHILTNSITNIDQGQIASSVDKSKYSLNDILSMAKKEGKASDINDITTVRFMEWTNGSALTGTALLEIVAPEPTPDPTPTPTDPTGELLNLTIGDNGEIKIPNKKAGADMKVNIEKIWAGDTGFESLRPESIEVELLRKNPDGTLDSSFTTDKKTLNSANNWKAEWSNLDRLVADTDNAYKYYIKEISNVPNYNVSYSNNNTEGIDATGTITITNTLKTTDINVTKKWVESDGTTEITSGTPNVIVQLQWKNGDNWEDIPGKTLNLTSANSYTGKFENLPDGKDYQVVEKNAPTGWTKVSDGNASNNYTITNKRDSGSLKVEKHWEDGGDTTKRPNEIQIAIYRKAAETITVTNDKVVETNESFEITFGNSSEKVTDFYCKVEGADNIYVSGIANDSKSVSPVSAVSSVRLPLIVNNGICHYTVNNGIALKKVGIAPVVATGNFKVKYIKVKTNQNNIYVYGKMTGGGVNTAPDFIADDDIDNLVPDYNDAYYTTNSVNQYNDYARLLQYSLYFYDANMCGSQVENKSSISWRKNCHTYCSVDGGFHDAGDHVMFGLPQGFTASTLGWSYYEFKDSYDTLGLTDHYQTIMKYFCDFFVASTALNGDSVSSFLYQKGNGDTDHNYWGSPENQIESQFGQKEYWTTDGASDIAANYAATLAQYAINFPNDTDSNNYLKYAKALYDFSTKNNKCTSDGPSGFYWDERTDATDEQAWAATWLYLATNDSKYKTESQSKIINAQNKLNGEPRGHFWNNTTLGAATVYASHIDKTNADIKKIMTDYLTKNCIGTDYRIVDWGDWGSARHNTLLQTVALSASKNFDDIDYTDWCAKQMRYILGENNGNICLVTGFARNSVTHVHHRAASVTQSNENYAHILVGALAGGPGSTSFANYPNDVNNYKENEVACDYNAGLVAAAAGLYDAYGTGKTYANIDIASMSLLNNISVPTYDAESQSDDMTVEETQEDVLDGMALDNPNVDVAAGEEVLLKSVILAKNASNNTTNVNNQFDTVKNVKRIEFKYIFNESVTGAGAGPIKYNNSVNLFDTEWNEFDRSSDGKICTKSYNVSNVDVSSINLGKIYWWDNSPSEMSLIVNFYGEDTGIQITSSKEITISEGSAATITANKSATWSISDCGNAVVFDGTYENTDTVNIRANSYYNGNITITATASDGTTDTVTVAITGADIQILEGTDDVGNSIKIHQGATKTVTVSPLGGDVTVNVENESIVTVTPESAQANAINAAIPLPTGRCNINAGSTIGNTDITFTRNGVSKTINAEVVGDLTINGSAKMNKNSTQTLTVENDVGAVWWEVLEGNEYISIDNWTGEVTSKSTTGVTATVKVYDIGGQEATFTITIDLTAVEPDIPKGSEFVKNITLNSGNNWQAVVGNLDKVDENGNPYHYYIVELGSTGRPATEINGNGVKYIPVGYEGNGATITGNDTVLSVTNEKSETEKPGYTLPSAGGKGADWYYIIGAGLMSGAVVMFVRRRRRSA